MADYTPPEIETDPGSLKESMIDRLQAAIPGLAVRDGHPINVLLEGASEVYGDLFFLLGANLDEGYASIGKNLLRTPQREATQAVGAATITATDTAGHSIPAGTRLTLQGLDGSRVGFETTATVTITAGSSTTGVGAVPLIAVEAGAAGTGLQADPVLEDALAWVNTITVVAPTVGGEDAEDIDTYRNRLADTAQLLGTTLVLPRDFEIDARNNVTGVTRALALDLYQPAVNEVQQITVVGTGGTYTLTFEGQTTGAIAYNASAGTLQTALEALSNIAPGDVIVTGGPGATAPLVVTFTGVLAASNRTQMTFASSVTGPGASVTVQTNVQGQAAAPSTASTISVAVVDDAGLDPGATVRAAGQARQQELAAGQITVTWIAATYTTVPVTFNAVCYAEFDPADVKLRAEQAVTDFLSPGNWGLPPFGDGRDWINKPTVRYRDLVAVIENVEGLDYTTSVLLNGGTADVSLTGAAPLPTPGTVAGTVTAP